MRSSRVVAVVVALCLAASSASADADQRKAKRIELAGEWLTAIGAVDVLVGVPLLAVGITTPTCANHMCNDAGAYFFPPAFGILGAGAVLIGVGLPLWIVGDRRLRRVERSGLQ